MGFLGEGNIQESLVLLFVNGYSGDGILKNRDIVMHKILYKWTFRYCKLKLSSMARIWLHIQYFLSEGGSTVMNTYYFTHGHVHTLTLLDSQKLLLHV